MINTIVFLLLVLVIQVRSRKLDDKVSDSEIVDILETLIDNDVYQKRIIGGSEIDTGDWPWLVSLRASIGNLRVTCGGSLVGDQWVLTAAHCFTNAKLKGKDRKPKYWKARMGDKDLEASLFEKFKSMLGSIFDYEDWLNYNMDVHEIIIHPSYEGPGNLWLNDVALVKLEEKVPSGSDTVPRVQSIALPDASLKDSDWPPDKDKCMMKGWGCTELGGPVEDVAKEVDLPKLTDKKCAWLWQIQAIYRLCAGYNYANKGICTGDSGGPLVCKDGDRWVQAGIASFTSAAYPENFPGAFTRVTHYIDWIYETMKKN